VPTRVHRGELRAGAAEELRGARAAALQHCRRQRRRGRRGRGEFRLRLHRRRGGGGRRKGGGRGRREAAEEQPGVAGVELGRVRAGDRGRRRRAPGTEVGAADWGGEEGGSGDVDGGDRRGRWRGGREAVPAQRGGEEGGGGGGDGFGLGSGKVGGFA